MILFGYYNYFIILKIQFIIWGAVWVRVGAEPFTPTRVPAASAAGTDRRRPLTPASATFAGELATASSALFLR